MRSASPPNLRDMEGWAYVRRRFLSKSRRQYVRLSGSVVTFHATSKAPIESDISVEGATLAVLFRRATVVLNLLSGSKLYLQFQTRELCQRWVAALETAASRCFEDLYELAEKIGEGAFASVHKAIRKADGHTVAVKQIKKKQFDMQMARELEREMYAMNHISHPGLMTAHDVFNTQQRVLIVMDYMRGGTLKDNVQAHGGKISEKDALPIMKQVLAACAHLHAHGYVHRDLKLENVLCEKEGIPASSVRLADFGYVNFVDDPRDLCLRSLVGTPVYVAPEIIKQQLYGPPVDVYSVGVMLHRMLVGCYPFDAKDDEKTMELAVKGDLRLVGKAWDKFSSECKSFVYALLQPRPETRITAAAALQHPWFKCTSFQDVLNRETRRTSCSGQASPAMVSPVTPDFSLGRKQSRSPDKLDAFRDQLPVRERGLKPLLSDRRSKDERALLSVPGEKTSTCSSQVESGSPTAVRRQRLRRLLRTSILAILFVAKLRLHAGVYGAPSKRAYNAIRNTPNKANQDSCGNERPGHTKRRLPTFIFSEKSQRTFHGRENVDSGGLGHRLRRTFTFSKNLRA